MSLSYGNKYTIEQLDNGVVSFRHIQSGEILHGNVGPEKEARTLYLEASGLIQSERKTLTVFDIGTGCAAQLLALLDFMMDSHTVERLRIFSFDLEKEGISAIRAACDVFPAARRHSEFLEKALQTNQLHWEMHNTTHNSQIEWNFIEGDFRKTISTLKHEFPDSTPDFIFYDFFSPANHPWLWTYNVFSNLKKHTYADTRLVTYSSATCVKAALLAAGWFVGTTIASGKKARSIFAAGSLNHVESPLTDRFISTFQTSHKPYCDAETDESKKIIAEKVASHPQFIQTKTAE